MSITSEKNRMAAYTTDAVETEFDFDFLIHAASEVQVWHKETGLNYYRLTLNTHYGVVFTEAGGTVSTDGFRAPLIAGTLLIIRHIDITQETNWIFNDNHTGPQHEDDFDRSVMRDLQQQEEIDRSPKFLSTSGTTEITMPEPEAASFITWNTDADDLTNTTISEIASEVASVLEGTEVPVIGSAGLEMTKPGNVAGDNGNWLLAIDSSGHFIWKHRESGIWKKRGPRIRGS